MIPRKIASASNAPSPEASRKVLRLSLRLLTPDPCSLCGFLFSGFGGHIWLSSLGASVQVPAEETVNSERSKQRHTREDRNLESLVPKKQHRQERTEQADKHQNKAVARSPSERSRLVPSRLVRSPPVTQYQRHPDQGQQTHDPVINIATSISGPSV